MLVRDHVMLVVRQSWKFEMLLAVVSASSPALGQDVLPGRDYWQTRNPTSVTFGGAGDLPAIPADFFFLGSPPFSGTVPLIGAPIDPSNLASTDTIIERPDPAVLPVVPSTDTVPIEMVQLSLVSVQPITVGGQQFNLRVKVPADPPQMLPPSGGMITIAHNHPDGGTFTSMMDVTAQIRFVPLGGGAPIDLPSPPTLHLTNAPNCWSYTPPPGHPFPGEGPNFFPSVCPGTGGGVIQPVTEAHPMGALHTVASPGPLAPVPAMSIPGVAALAGVVLLTGMALRRRSVC